MALRLLSQTLAQRIEPLRLRANIPIKFIRLNGLMILVLPEIFA